MFVFEVLEKNLKLLPLFLEIIIGVDSKYFNLKLFEITHSNHIPKSNISVEIQPENHMTENSCYSFRYMKKIACSLISEVQSLWIVYYDYRNLDFPIK